MGKYMKAAKAVIAVAAWLAAHTSFATETITATGTAGAVAGASAGAIAGAQSGAAANGSQIVNGGNTRALGVGMAAAVSPNACDSAVLWGMLPWESEMCALRMISTHLYNMGHTQAATLVMCQDSRARYGLSRAGFQCPAEGSRGPVFQTGAEGESGYQQYAPYRN